MITVKFSTLRGGVFIEQDATTDDYRPSTRCFRFNADRSVEWSPYGDLMSNNPAPRFFGHVFTVDQFIIC